MHEDIVNWIIQWFRQFGPLTDEEAQSKKAINFFSMGWIDSLHGVSLVLAIEKKFKVRFTNEEFQDTKMTTIDGLAHAVERKIGVTN